MSDQKRRGTVTLSIKLRSPEVCRDVGFGWVAFRASWLEGDTFVVGPSRPNAELAWADVPASAEHEGT